MTRERGRGETAGAYERRRLTVRASPSASDRTLPNPRSGHELAVFGKVLVGAAGGGAEGLADAAGRGAAAGAAASVACTCCSVMTCGGRVVMIVADSLSP